MQSLKTIIAAAIMAAGVNASAIPRNEGVFAPQSLMCDVPPNNACLPIGPPANCEFCCINFVPGPWSDCHKHEDVACNSVGKIWHCESHK